MGVLDMSPRSPFATAQTQAELIAMVKSGKLPPFPAHVSPMLKQVVRAMLTLNVSPKPLTSAPLLLTGEQPVKRPSTKDLLDMDEMKLHRKLFTVQNQYAYSILSRGLLTVLKNLLVAGEEGRAETTGRAPRSP